MRSQLPLSFIALILFSLSHLSASFAQADTCRQIKSEKKRLVCYDSKNKETEVEQASVEARKLKEVEETQKAEAARAKAEFLAAVRPCLLALRKMESRVTAGITYRDYFQPLADADFELQRLIKDPRAMYNASFSKKLIAVYFHYDYAGDIWKMKFDSRPPSNYMTPTVTLSKYPNANQYLVSGNLISYSDMLSVIWGEASRELDEAEAML